MTPLAAPEAVLQQLSDLGVRGVHGEALGDLLVLRLSGEEQGRLLADQALREAIVSRARAAGFPRVVLEIKG